MTESQKLKIFMDDIGQVFVRHKLENDITVAGAIGCLEIFKHTLMDENKKLSEKQLKRGGDASDS